MKKICVLFSIITIATASLNTETDNLLSTALKFVRDCGDKSMLLCAKVSKFPFQHIFTFEWNFSFIYLSKHLRALCFVTELMKNRA